LRGTEVKSERDSAVGQRETGVGETLLKYTERRDRLARERADRRTQEAERWALSHQLAGARALLSVQR